MQAMGCKGVPALGVGGSWQQGEWCQAMMTGTPPPHHCSLNIHPSKLLPSTLAHVLTAMRMMAAAAASGM